jgi:hypothetical protein
LFAAQNQHIASNGTVWAKHLQNCNAFQEPTATCFRTAIGRRIRR